MTIKMRVKRNNEIREIPMQEYKEVGDEVLLYNENEHALVKYTVISTDPITLLFKTGVSLQTVEETVCDDIIKYCIVNMPHKLYLYLQKCYRNDFAFREDLQRVLYDYTDCEIGTTIWDVNMIRCDSFEEYQKIIEKHLDIKLKVAGGGGG